MSKFRLDNPNGTSLDPFAYEKQFAQPNFNNPSPYSGVASSLEVVAPDRVDEGYGTMGNSGYAMQAINEAKAANQGAGELLAKGLGNVVKTIGIEVAKTPGYLGGMIGAIGNETIGDGKQSMEMIVDNAWVNAFESLDQSIKEAMPVYMSKTVQEGNLLNKLGSGAWWAEAGADGLGFMLSMFVPGAALKAVGIGAKIAAGAEGLANLSGKLGKVATGESWVAKLGLMTAPEGRVAAAVEAKTAELMAKGGGVLDDVAKAEIAAVAESTRKAAGSTYKYTQGLARNANGYSSAIINTALESSAEAANTFDNLKKNYLAEGLTEDEAQQKAGEGAAAVFKGNMALLVVSNVLDEAWIWKSIGSAGEKEAAKSLMSKIFKDGVVDPDALKNLPKEFTRAKTLKRVGTNFGKGILKEGGYEEGSQTTLQQNIEKGKVATEGNVFEKVLDDLYNVGASYFDDFANNTELHESIFLGGLLGGGASIIGTIQENQALKGALHGSEARTKDNNIFAKYGLLPETKAQKGLGKILQEAHINQFRSYKDVMTTDENGKFVIDEQKLVDANLERAEEFKMNILYDLAVAQGDKLSQEIFGQALAANYVRSFTGQEGGKELFQDHAKNHVLPAWQKRFQETFSREATAKESQEYLNQFTSSGNRIFDAHKIAEETNYPQRYFHEKSKDYQDFRGDYFQKKFQLLVALDSFKSRKQDIMNEVSEAGLTMSDLEDISQVTDPVKLQKILEIKNDLKRLNESEQELSQEYNDFYTKEGVKKMFEDFKTKRAQFKEITTKVEELNKDLKAKVDAIPERNSKELTRLETILAEQGADANAVFKDKNGKRYTIDQLENDKTDITDLGLTFDDVEKKELDDPFNVSDTTLKKIANRITKGLPLSGREQFIRDANSEKIENLLNAENLKEEALEEAKTGEVPNTSVEDTEYDVIDQTIEDVYTKLGVNMFPSTGLNVSQKEVTLIDGLYVEKMTPSASQKLWFETLENEVKKNPQGYTVKVVRNDDTTNEELHKQINRNTATDAKPGDLTTVLHKDGKPVMKNGNYVFTGLGRPESMYDIGEKKLYSRIAKSAILDNFFVSLGMMNVKIDKLTKAQKGVLEAYGIEDPTKDNIERQAYLHAKKEYKDWYESLQSSSGQHLQVAGVTKGHAVKMYEDEGKTKRAWRSPLQGIPGLKLEGNKLVGGKFAMSVLGFIDVAGERFTIPSGDVVIVDDDKNVHPMRPRNINESEVQTVLHLLSLRDTKGPTEAITVEAPENIIFGTSGSTKVPVFFNKANPRQTIIGSLISFGSKPDGKNKTGGKGEIYFSKESLAKDPILVWTDFEGKTNNLPVRLITEALETNDFTKIQGLVDFLGQKRFNVNEALLGTSLISPKFSKPMTTFDRDETGKRIPVLNWDQNKSYFHHMLNDVLSTTTQNVDGYPSRVQRNLWFHRQPIANEVESIVEETATQKLLRSTLSDLGIAIKSEENLISLSDILDAEKTFTTNVLQRRLSIGYQKASLLKDIIDKANGFVETVNTGFIKGKPPRDTEFRLATSDLRYRIFGVNETVQVFADGMWNKTDARIVLRTAETQGYRLVNQTVETPVAQGNKQRVQQVQKEIQALVDKYRVEQDSDKARSLLAEITKRLNGSENAAINLVSNGREVTSNTIVELIEGTLGIINLPTESQAEKDASWERIKDRVAGEQIGSQERKDEKAKADKAYQEERQKQKDHSKAQDAERAKLDLERKEWLNATYEAIDKAFYAQEHVKMMGLTKITTKEVDNIIDVLYPGLRPGYTPLTTKEVEAIKKARNFDFVATHVGKSFAGKLANTAMSVISEEPKTSRRSRTVKSLDEFKDDMDKILTTADLFKMKIKSGEIIQNCK